MRKTPNASKVNAASGAAAPKTATVLDFAKARSRKAVALLRAVAEIAEEEGMADLVIIYKRDGKEDYALAGRYLQDTTEASKSALHLAYLLADPTGGGE